MNCSFSFHKWKSSLSFKSFFSSDLYVGTAWSGVVEVPGDLIAAFVMVYLGRRRTVAIGLIM